MSGSKIRLYGSTSGYVELQAPAVAPDGVLTLPATTGAFGGLVAVKHVLKTDTFSASLTAGASTAVTGMSITHALASATNKLIISVYFGATGNVASEGAVGIQVYDGSGYLAQGDTASNRTRVIAGTTNVGSPTYHSNSHAVTFVHAPGDTSSRTYEVYATNIRTDTRTIYVNRSDADTDNAQHIRSSSSFVIQEVSV